MLLVAASHYSSTMSEEEDPKTIKFNVGGTRYEVARSLIKMHPDTMLARIVAKEWQTDPGEEVFIERNGSRFKHVLDYLRDGKAYASNDVCKEAILDELQYFGISYQERDVQHGQLGSIHSCSNESILARSTSKIFRFVPMYFLNIPRPFFQKRLEFTVYDDGEKEFYDICVAMAEIISSRSDSRKQKLQELCEYYGFSVQEIKVVPPRRDRWTYDPRRCIVGIRSL